MITLQSRLDSSVNFVTPSDGGYLEARYVRRAPDYFCCYLSSQNGCNRGCTFCHLTTSGQTSFVHASELQYLAQAARVLNHYKGQPPARYVNFNFMARGEPLANPTFAHPGASSFLERLGTEALALKLLPRFNVSTIMPRTLRVPLEEVFDLITPTIYYSAYSPYEAIRKSLMPGAMPFHEALKMLKAYQRHSLKVVKIHYALIEGVNDSETATMHMLEDLADEGLHVEFNLVQYNPASDAQGRASTPLAEARVLDILRRELGPERAKAVQRVGYDVQASCGMFVGPPG